jgi:hypothetical protein
MTIDYKFQTIFFDTFDRVWIRLFIVKKSPYRFNKVLLQFMKYTLN